MNYHHFNVYCLSEKKILKGERYWSVDDIKKSAYELYKDGNFNDDNTILTYLDENEVEVLLTLVPDLPQRGGSKDLFIRFVRPICAMCSNPFGIVDNQLLLQCSKQKCGEQYCNSCVQASRCSSSEYPFVCISCKKEVTPKRNMLIEQYIIWKSMCQLYGAQSLLDLKKDSNQVSCHSLLQNIKLRRIHLQSRLVALRNRMARGNSIHSTDEQLITDVNQLYSSLTHLIEEVEMIEQDMDLRSITVDDCLRKYKKAMKHFDDLCHVLVETAMRLSTLDNNNTSNVTPAHKQHIQNLDKLSPDENIKAIDRILEDIDVRYRYLSSNVESITLLLNDQPDRMKPLKKDLERANKTLETMTMVEEELKYIRQSLQAIDGYTDDYDQLLRDDQFSGIPCSKFILLMERMRVRTEELEILNSFPQTGQAMKAWQNDFGTDDEFKPKAIDLFKAIEQDVQHLFTDYNWIYSVPYKVGVIGHGSVGKSALVMKLTEIEEFSSMIAIERSTFGYLQFDTLMYKGPLNGKIIPITFIDIEGATDADEFVSTGNYLELIKKADCDMYVIVFDNFFNDHNNSCRMHIKNKLKRNCVLVRSKADLLFNQYFHEATKKKYEKTVSKDRDTKIALSKTRNYALKTFDDKSLNDEVYLTAAVCDDNLKGADFAEFDIKKLKKEMVKLAMNDLRGQRICDLATRAAITVINTCFRRGYTVSQTKYKWLAAGASLIPFLDELPKYFGREKIRQAFGIHDSCAVTNAVRKTKDSFEQYLTEKNLTIPQEYLVSGEFKYLRPTKTKQATTDTNVPQKSIYTVEDKSTNPQNNRISIGHPAQIVARHVAVGVGVTAGALVDDAVRVVAPAATITTRTALIVGVIVTAALAPIFAAWSFYSTGKGMNKELHSICDDLVIILQHFVANRCNDCFQNIELPIDASSSDEDE